MLMTEEAYRGLAQHSAPEMSRCSLAGVTLQLKALGIDNVSRFEFLSPPPPQSLANALELLFALGAIDERGALTSKGERMAQLPLEPDMGAVLLGAAEEACVDEA